MGVIAKDGFCRPFDHKASGYTRSEAVCVMYLQRKRDAKRIYANLVYSKANCDGFKIEGITYPSGDMQQHLLTEFYDDLQLDPTSLTYIEAHATGTGNRNFTITDSNEIKTSKFRMVSFHDLFTLFSIILYFLLLCLYVPNKRKQT